MKFRKYDREKDKKEAQRIWIECGWIEDDDKDKKAFDIFTASSRCSVVDSKGSPECLIMTSPGKMKYGTADLSLSAVSAVTVSRLLRKHGAAPRLLASMLKEDIDNGVDVAGLGMFEQGFYNRLGFGTMGYEHWYSFDPAKLKVFRKGGIPLRISAEDFKDAHQCYIDGRKQHGFVTLDPPELMHGEMLFCKNGFGLGYKADGKLSHYLWFSTDDVEEGPYDVRWMAFRTWDQFLELMGIIKNLEEQVRTIRMKEPTSIQLQDFIDKPFQLQTITRKGKFESRMRSIAYQQLRICNLESCIKAVQFDGDSFSFNLTLSDPINEFLEDQNQFEGCSGDFSVTVGMKSKIEKGHKKSLPLIKGSINGFTRLWIGVLRASTIGLVEDLEIDEDLIEKLEKAFYKPDARSDWDY